MNRLDRAVLDAIGKGATSATEIRKATGGKAVEVAESVRRLRWQGRVAFDRIALNSTEEISSVPLAAEKMQSGRDGPREGREWETSSCSSAPPTPTPFDAGLAPDIDVAADEASCSLQPSATLPPEPSHATSAVPVASSSKTTFRSWAEDYAPQRDWKYDRQADLFERAKAFLQRRMPVYAADIAGGDKGKFVVGSRTLTRDDLVALAKAKGWQG